MFLEHVNMSVADLERSVAFYGKLFGFRVRWRGTTNAGNPAVHIGTDKYYLALFETPTGGRAERDYARVGVNHLAFVVDDLDAMRERLAELEVQPHLEEDYEPGRRLYFLDPDGVEVELVNYDTTD